MASENRLVLFTNKATFNIKPRKNQIIVGGDNNCDLKLNIPVNIRPRAKFFRIYLDSNSEFKIEKFHDDVNVYVNKQSLQLNESRSLRSGDIIIMFDTKMRWVSKQVLQPTTSHNIIAPVYSPPIRSMPSKPQPINFSTNDEMSPTSPPNNAGKFTRNAYLKTHRLDLEHDEILANRRKEMHKELEGVNKPPTFSKRGATMMPREISKVSASRKTIIPSQAEPSEDFIKYVKIQNEMKAMDSNQKGKLRGQSLSPKKREAKSAPRKTMIPSQAEPSEDFINYVNIQNELKDVDSSPKGALRGRSYSPEKKVAGSAPRKTSMSSTTQLSESFTQLVEDSAEAKKSQEQPDTVYHELNFESNEQWGSDLSEPEENPQQVFIPLDEPAAEIEGDPIFILSSEDESEGEAKALECGFSVDTKVVKPKRGETAEEILYRIKNKHPDVNIVEKSCDEEDEFSIIPWGEKKVATKRRKTQIKNPKKKRSPAKDSVALDSSTKRVTRSQSIKTKTSDTQAKTSHK